MPDVRKVLQSLVTDIEAMHYRVAATGTFGPFKEGEMDLDIDGPSYTIEWPNLAALLQEAKEALSAADTPSYAVPKTEAFVQAHGAPDDTTMDLLRRSLAAWEDEEESVQEEHADLIAQIRAHVNGEPVMHEYAFDVALRSVVRVKAESEAEARNLLATIDAWEPPFNDDERGIEITEVSAVANDAGQVFGKLFEIDQEMQP